MLLPLAWDACLLLAQQKRSKLHEQRQALVPLVGFDEFIETLCDRIGQAQELLPYAGGNTIQLDDVTVSFTVPDGLTERIGSQINRFGASA